MWRRSPLRTTLLTLAHDMAVVTATARQPLPDAPNNARANRVLHDVTRYLESNQLLVHNVKLATMVDDAPPLPLRTGDRPMTPTDNATYLGIQQAATPKGVTLPPNLERQLTRTPVIARIAALSTQALAYFLKAVLNAAIRFQALRPDTPQTHASKGRHHSLMCVGHPRPPAHVPPCRGSGSIGSLLWGRHRPPSP